MKKTTALVIISFSVIVTVLCSISPGRAAFKENIWPARASGMGGAFAAVSNDASAFIFNPAGLSQIERPEVNFGYTQKFAGLPSVSAQNTAAFVGWPFENIGAFGFSYIASDVSSLYAEQSVTLCYSAPIHKLLGTKTVTVGKRSMEFPLFPLPLYAGINVKMLAIRYNTSEDINARNNPILMKSQGASGPAVDIGFLVKPTDKLSAAIVLKNLLSPDLAIGDNAAGDKYSEHVPTEFLLGAAWHFGDIRAFEDFTVALDIINRAPKDATAETNWRLGAETWFAHHKYAARLGFNNTELAMGGGIIHSVGPVELQFDYAFALPLAVPDNFGHHRLSVTARF